FTMSREINLSPRIKSEVKTLLLHTSYSQRQIAELVDQPLSPKRKGKYGRKRITTPRSDRKIGDIGLQNRKKNG
ncbi:putative transposase like protein, partial [Danaus plexippus plexippus]